MVTAAPSGRVIVGYFAVLEYRTSGHRRFLPPGGRNRAGQGEDFRLARRRLTTRPVPDTPVDYWMQHHGRAYY